MTEEKNLLFVKSKDRSAWLDRMRRDPRVSHSAFRFSFRLAQVADETGTLSEKLVDLAGRAGVHPPTLISGLERLARLGYIGFERGDYGLPWQITIQPAAPARRDTRPARA